MPVTCARSSPTRSPSSSRSPPYFAGKEYEESLGTNGVPGTYFEYLALLKDVFSECKRVLEPGGRIAVNVANLGRRPYRSLAGDVVEILQDLGLLVARRGGLVKGRAAGGSCAWGTFPTSEATRCSATSPSASSSQQGPVRPCHPTREAARSGLPSTSTISRDEFLEATTDLWEILPESATRVGHPAPFPVELPRRLIDLFTYEGDVVLDPSSVRARRRSPPSVAIALRRVSTRTPRTCQGEGTDQAGAGTVSAATRPRSRPGSHCCKGVDRRR